MDNINTITVSEKHRDLIDNIIALNNYARKNEQSTYTVSDFINERMMVGYKEKLVEIPVGYKYEDDEFRKAITFAAYYNTAIHGEHSSGSFSLNLLDSNQSFSIDNISSLPETIADPTIGDIRLFDIKCTEQKEKNKFTEIIRHIAKAYKLLPIIQDNNIYICYYKDNVLNYKTLNTNSIKDTLFETIKTINCEEPYRENLKDFACSTYSIINILDASKYFAPTSEAARSVLYIK